MMDKLWRNAFSLAFLELQGFLRRVLGQTARHLDEIARRLLRCEAIIQEGLKRAVEERCLFQLNASGSLCMNAAALPPRSVVLACCALSTLGDCIACHRSSGSGDNARWKHALQGTEVKIVLLATTVCFAKSLLEIFPAIE